MAFISINQVEKLQRQQQCIFWKVTDKTKKLVINRYDSLTDFESSVELLKDTLTNCIGDYVIVTLYTTKPEKLEKNSTAGKQFEVMVQLESVKGFQSVPNYQSMAGASFNDILELNKEILELKHQKKLDEIEASQKPTALEKLADQLLQGNTLNLLVGAFMNKMNPTTSNGINKPASATDEILKKFAAVDPDYENTLAKMADYISKNPSVLAQIKMIIGA